MSALEIGKRPETRCVATFRHRGTLVVLAATLVMAMGFGGLGLISVFMAPMEADLGWTRSNTSLGYAIAATGMAGGGLLWGRVSDRVDIRLMLAIGATGMVSSLFAMAMQQSLMTYYVANLIYGGFGFSLLYAPLVSTSGEWFPQQRGLVTGVVTAGGALGQGLLPFAGTFLIEESGWRLAFAEIAGNARAQSADPQMAARDVGAFCFCHGLRQRGRGRIQDSGPVGARRFSVLCVHGRTSGSYG
jgi:sugar phosphate permease